MAVKFTPENNSYTGDTIFANHSADDIENVRIDTPDMLPPGLDTIPFNPHFVKDKRSYQITVCKWLYPSEREAEMYVTPQNLTPGYPEIVLSYKYIKQRGGIRVQLPHEGKYWYGRLIPT